MRLEPPVRMRRLRMLLDVRTAKRLVASTVYSTVARHLPWSPRPFGQYARSFRAFLAGYMLDNCGKSVNIEHGATFGSGRGISVGDRSDIGMDALVIGPVMIGADVMMGPRCILLANNHAHTDTSIPMNRQGLLEDRPIIVEDDVWIGAGTVVLPGRILGRGCIVGAGSVVARDIPPWAIAAGNPAVVKRYRLESETEHDIVAKRRT